MKNYFMESPRLSFSRWEETDLPLARSLWGDPQVAACVSPRPFMTEEEVLERLERELDCEREYQIQYWPVFVTQTGEFVGCCGIRPHETAGKVEMGFHLRPPFWGQGVGREAAQRVLSYAFSSDCPYSVETVWIGHHPKNERSGGLIQRLGFRFVRMEDYPGNAGQYPSYEMTAADWDRLQRAADKI